MGTSTEKNRDEGLYCCVFVHTLVFFCLFSYLLYEDILSKNFSVSNEFQKYQCNTTNFSYTNYSYNNYSKISEYAYIEDLNISSLVIFNDNHKNYSYKIFNTNYTKLEDEINKKRNEFLRNKIINCCSNGIEIYNDCIINTKDELTVISGILIFIVSCLFCCCGISLYNIVKICYECCCCDN